VVDADAAAIQADDALMDLLLGDARRIRAANDGDVAPAQCPLLEYTIVSQIDTERFCEVRIQWDVLVRTDSELAQVERRLYLLFNRETAASIGGLGMVESRYQDRREIAGLPDGIRGASMEFLQKPARLRYVRPADS
jgi:hypothetical protein